MRFSNRPKVALHLNIMQKSVTISCLIILQSVFLSYAWSFNSDSTQKQTLGQQSVDLNLGGPKKHFTAFHSEGVFRELWSHLRYYDNDTSTCSKDIIWFLRKLQETVIKNVTEENFWAVNMIDAMGKPPWGILEGDIHWTGNYRQCLDITATDNNLPSSVRFRGEYCVIKFPISKFFKGYGDFTIPLFVGVCLPDTCSYKEKSVLFDKLFSPLKHAFDVEVSFEENLCQTKNGIEMDTTAIIIWASLIFLTTVVLIATLFHMLFIRLNSLQNLCTGQWGEIIIPEMSAITSARTIFNIKNKPGDITAINGIRFLSIIMVISIHYHLGTTITNFFIKNPKNVIDIMKSFALQPLEFNSSFSVDTFFVLSGLLLMYTSTKRKPVSTIQDVIKMIAVRYTRLTPAYIVALLFMAGPMFYIGEGPVWPLMKRRVVNCRQTWWKNLLYINNYQAEFDCVGPWWYLAADFQLYIFASVVLLIYNKKKPLGHLLLLTSSGIAIFAAISTIRLSGYTFNYWDLSTISKMNHYITHMYKSSWYHVPSYSLGMATGYYLHRFEENPSPITKTLSATVWTTSAATIFWFMYGNYFYANNYLEWTHTNDILYGSLARPLWAAAVCWIIFRCATDNGGFLNKLLSLKVFNPLSRLTYSTYLLHYLVIEYYFLTQQVPYFTNATHMIVFIIAITSFSLVAGIILAVLIEIPTFNLTKQFLQ